MKGMSDEVFRMFSRRCEQAIDEGHELTDVEISLSHPSHYAFALNSNGDAVAWVQFQRPACWSTRHEVEATTLFRACVSLAQIAVSRRKMAS